MHCCRRRERTFRRSVTLLVLLLLFMVMLPACAGKKEIKQEEEFSAEKSLAKANELIEKKEYEEARRVLLEVKNRDLTKKYAPLAQLRIADSYAREEEFDLAVEEYRRFLEIYPDHQNAAYAQYQIAMTYFSQIESPDRGYGAAAKALEEFEKLKRKYPRNPYKEIADMRIDKARNTMADYEFLVGEYYFKKGSYRAAVGRFEDLLKKYPDYKKESVVLLRAAQSRKRLGDKEQAEEYYRRLVEKYPDDGITKEATKEFAPGK